MTELFDFDKALKAIQSGQAISGQGGVLAPLLKQLTEAVNFNLIGFYSPQLAALL